ncbi:unnamed protein product [Blepharisma stoltei]|uniref:Uncharacterized protein n=1 Tax=Blepharisma stoltei TaxID=1481888 RepID=A0AAU9IX76_9CILI|nr:unnamed protein product [Blepharisma stoltei]
MRWLKYFFPLTNLLPYLGPGAAETDSLLNLLVSSANQILFLRAHSCKTPSIPLRSLHSYTKDGVADFVW